MLVLKFSPYFPPHKWWLESHIQERSFHRTKKWYGQVINITTPMGQNWQAENNNKKISFEWQQIWYRENWYQVIIYPAFDLIPIFPFPKFRSKKFRLVIKYLKKEIKKRWKENTIVNTHTRFFLTSLFGWLFAKRNNVKWIHIEHGVDFVKLSNKIKNLIAWIYDQTLWRYVFVRSDMVIGISNWCKKFANKFTKKEIPVIHRWMIFETTNKQKNKSDFIKIWFVGRLVSLKWVDLLLLAFANLSKKHKIKLEIVWDGDQYQNLVKLTKDLKIKDKVKFLWFKDRDFVANEFLPNIDIIVNPSYQEWLPTSVLEWLLSKSVVVATNVGWTAEISEEKDLILIEKWSQKELEKWLEFAILNYKELKWLSYNYVKDHFDWNKSIEEYFNVFNNA